jgi:hypothetical protein
MELAGLEPRPPGCVDRPMQAVRRLVLSAGQAATRGRSPVPRRGARGCQVRAAASSLRTRAGRSTPSRSRPRACRSERGGHAGRCAASPYPRPLRGRSDRRSAAARRSRSARARRCRRRPRGRGRGLRLLAGDPVLGAVETSVVRHREAVETIAPLEGGHGVTDVWSRAPTLPIPCGYRLSGSCSSCRAAARDPRLRSP